MINQNEIQRGIFQTVPGDPSKLTRIGHQMYNPVCFFEQIPFSREVPYTVRAKSFPENEVCPLHYASSIEILLIRDCQGTVTIGPHIYTLSGRDCFFIPPFVVHSTVIQKGSGILYGIKISPENISAFINIESLLYMHHKTLYHLALVQNCFNQAYQIMSKLIEQDDDGMLRMIQIISLFHLLSSTADAHSASDPEPEIEVNSLLNQLIRWTGEHYMERVTVEQAADILHFSKSHFCRFFKKNTKITYLTYLNQVRLNQAAYFLETGKSVAFTSNACGFSNVSYFIGLFRDFFGCTPGEYVQKREQRRSLRSI